MRITANETTAQTLTRLLAAADRHHPITITYTKADNTETIRTIEIHDVRTTKAGHVILRAADRQSREMRTWRLDRITAYTTHRTAYTVALPDDTTPAPATPATVEQLVTRELDRDEPTTTHARKVFEVRGMTDQITQCELCGRDELRGTVQLLELDADGTPFADHYYGTGCAAKAAGWTQREVKNRVKAADQARRDAESAARAAAADARYQADLEHRRAWCLENYGTRDVDAAARIAGVSPVRIARLAWEAQDKQAYTNAA